MPKRTYCSIDYNARVSLRHFDNKSASPDPVIICGSGIAGCLAALKIAAHSPVVLLTKSRLGAGNTRHAQGGIAAALDPADSIASHLADTLAAGAGLCDPEAARAVCAHGPDCVRELIALGVAFDGGARPALGLEAAHAAPRIVHVDGDATGRGVMAALTAAVRAEPGIEIREGWSVTGVIRRDDTAIGVRAIDPTGALREHAGRAVVLATGGIGQLFPHTTNPEGSCGDGIALAARAGAALADMEMIQFHPTALAVGGSPLPLISEAVRGAGAVLRDIHGERFLDGRDGLTELGPRDRVARAIFRRARDTGAPVSLDLRGQDANEVHSCFPGISAICRAHGLDLARDPIPVTPAAHYFMGGVLTDVAGRTGLPGLFAIGECASTGAHGANRLASNSLLEGAMMADRAARAIRADGPWPDLPLGREQPEPRLGPASAAWHSRLREAMWAGAGLERSADGLATATAALDALVPAPDREAAGMLLVGRATLEAAAHRRESRGAHHRLDHPATDAAQARRIAWCDGVPLELPDTRKATIRRAA